MILHGNIRDSSELEQSATISFHNRPRVFEELPLFFRFQIHEREIESFPCPWGHRLLLPFFLLVNTQVICHYTYPRRRTLCMAGFPFITACDYNTIGDPITIFGTLKSCFQVSYMEKMLHTDKKYDLMEKSFKLIFDHELINPLYDVIVMTFVIGMVF